VLPASSYSSYKEEVVAIYAAEQQQQQQQQQQQKEKQKQKRSSVSLPTDAKPLREGLSEDDKRNIRAVLNVTSYLGNWLQLDTPGLNII